MSGLKTNSTRVISHDLNPVTTVEIISWAWIHHIYLREYSISIYMIKFHIDRDRYSLGKGSDGLKFYTIVHTLIIISQ